MIDENKGISKRESIDCSKELDQRRHSIVMQCTHHHYMQWL
jgi:hypothetical protein